MSPEYDWLTSDEQRLLVYITLKIQRHLRSENHGFSNRELAVALGTEVEKMRSAVSRSSDDLNADNWDGSKKELDDLTDAPFSALTLLKKRGLLEFQVQGEPNYTPSDFEIVLAPIGLSVGQAYATWFSRSGIWFRKYKDHWIWFLLAVGGGGLVNWGLTLLAS
ncbi:MAG: hypothetical protein ACOCXA_09725 [Planctomycetota bacterium]